MVNKKTCCLSGAFCLGLVGIALLVAGLFVKSYVDDQIDDGVKDALKISRSDADDESDWDDFLESDIDYNYYGFHCTNPMQVLRGEEKPNFEEVGPYNYIEYSYKYNYGWLEDDSIFAYNLWWRKDVKTTSANDPVADRYTTVNPAYLGVLPGAWAQTKEALAVQAVGGTPTAQQIFDEARGALNNGLGFSAIPQSENLLYSAVGSLVLNEVKAIYESEDTWRPVSIPVYVGGQIQAITADIAANRQDIFEQYGNSTAALSGAIGLHWISQSVPNLPIMSTLGTPSAGAGLYTGFEVDIASPPLTDARVTGTLDTMTNVAGTLLSQTPGTAYSLLVDTGTWLTAAGQMGAGAFTAPEAAGAIGLFGAEVAGAVAGYIGKCSNATIAGPVFATVYEQFSLGAWNTLLAAAPGAWEVSSWAELGALQLTRALPLQGASLSSLSPDAYFHPVTDAGDAANRYIDSYNFGAEQVLYYASKGMTAPEALLTKNQSINLLAHMGDSSVFGVVMTFAKLIAANAPVVATNQAVVESIMGPVLAGLGVTTTDFGLFNNDATDESWRQTAGLFADWLSEYIPMTNLHRSVLFDYPGPGGGNLGDDADGDGSPFTYSSGIITTRSISDFLFGYTVPDALLALQGASFPGLDSSYASESAHMQETKQARYQIYTGIGGNFNEVRKYRAWRGVPYFDTFQDYANTTTDAAIRWSNIKRCLLFWGPGADECEVWKSRVTIDKSGTTRANTRPFAEDLDPSKPSSGVNVATLWNTNGARIVPFLYEKDVRRKGIKMRRYVVDTRMFMNQTTYTFNEKFYVDGPSGVIPAARISLGLPVWLSKPHFFDADPAVYTDKITGMTPGAVDHDTYIDIEPLSGATMFGTKKFQFNFLLCPGRADGDHNRARDDFGRYTAHLDSPLTQGIFAGQDDPNACLFWPFLWAEETGIIKDDDADDFVSSIYDNRDLADQAEVIGLSVGIVLTLLAITCGIFFARKRPDGFAPQASTANVNADTMTTSDKGM